ncbi:MAG: sugar phosphate nucleotidyltransferase [Vicinamibacterales bacterium]
MPCPDAALVLTAGFGTRLRPLSLVRAKPAVPLLGESVVRRVLRWLSRSGVRDVVLNLHHRPETIAAEVGDGADLGVSVRYSWEQPILGSAGGPRHALPLLGPETFVISNSDLTDVDLQAMADAHGHSGALVTLALTTDWDRRRYGGVALDDSGTVTHFVPKSVTERAFHFVGVQIVHRSVFSDLPDGVPLESFSGVYRTLMTDRPGSVRGFVSDAHFWDIGTPEDYLASALSLARQEGRTELPPGRNARVASSSRLVDTIVWDDVEIEEDCELVRCIVADGVRIPTGSRLADLSVIPALGHAVSKHERLMGNLIVAPIPTNHVE